MNKHYLIYLPGLGDVPGTSQKRAVSWWRIFGVQSEFFPVGWADGESFAAKQQRLQIRIDTLAKDGYKVSLVGTSAGGGAVVNVFAGAHDKLHKVVTVCGTIGGAKLFNPVTYQKNPAFEQSMRMIDKSLASLTQEDKRRILALQPLFDPIVYPHLARVPGAHNRRILTLTHVFSIAHAITFGMPKIIRFIKRSK